MNVYEAQQEMLEAEKAALEIRRKKILEELDTISDLPGMKLVAFAIFPPGVHRIMTGKVGSGLLYMFTGGGFLIWTIIDLITILTGKFKDKDGKYVKEPKRQALLLELEIVTKKIEEMD